jgi:NAD(P)-dependent dehydrogenase (short-subunit alcohol dehydrogenase family)
MQIQGSVAVVTGGSRGIGQAAVQALRAAGATVVTCAHDAGGPLPSVDVRDPAAVRTFVEGVLAQHGRIDMLICNAGWAEGMGLLESVTDEDYQRSMRTNVDGVFHFLRAVLPGMKQRNSGVIMNVASKAGSRPHPKLPVYSAAKAAVIALTRAVARELQEAQSEVLCFTVSPGGVGTDMREKLFGKEDRDQQQKPEEVAEILLAILSGDIDVPPGADAVIAQGKVEEITQMG